MNIDNRITERNGEFQWNPVGASRRERSVTSLPRGGSSDTTGTEVANSQSAGLTGNEVDWSETTADVQKTVETISNLVRSQQKDVSFSVDEDADTTVIKFFKTETGELIKQFPPDQILAMRARMRDTLGLFVDEQG